MTIPKYLQFSPFFVYDSKLTEEGRLKFSEDIEKLPPTLKDLLLSAGTAELIESSGKSNSLSEGQTEELSKIIRDVIMAYLYIGDMPSQIAVQANVDTVTARNIANQIVNQLFKPVLTDLKNIQKEKFSQKMSTMENTGPSAPSSTPPATTAPHPTPKPIQAQPPQRPLPPPFTPPANTPAPAQKISGTRTSQNNPGPKQYNVINLKDL